MFFFFQRDSPPLTSELNWTVSWWVLSFLGNLDVGKFLLVCIWGKRGQLSSTRLLSSTMLYSKLINFNSEEDASYSSETVSPAPERKPAKVCYSPVSWISTLVFDLILDYVILQVQCPRVLGQCHLLLQQWEGRDKWCPGDWCASCHLRWVLWGQWWNK